MVRFLATLLLCALVTPHALAVQAMSFMSTGQSSAAGPPYPTLPVIVDLGREIGGATTKTASVRHRAFYIIDRTIPTALEPGLLYDPNSPGGWALESRILVEHGWIEKAPLSPIPALSAGDVDFEVVDANGVQGQFVAMPGLPEGTYHQVTTTSTSVAFTYRVDVGDDGVTELTTACTCLTGYVLSNVQISTSGIGSNFHLVFDMDGPGGDNPDPMLQCTTTGSFTEAPVSATVDSWSLIKSLYRVE